ncbi:MAG TPA: phosphate-starvation-inducible PsiE family protein [Coriobacteriia bacterium]|nr:phosphate-starvation-inducible PsiE family protein [Coriobacteriia bacterium]
MQTPLMKRFLWLLNYLILGIEVAVAFALVALAGGALVALASEMLHIAGNGVALSRVEFNSIIGTILEIFILVELFRIAIAYMRHRNVIPTVLEAALVAVARKFVVFEGGDNYLNYALGMCALLISVAVSWYLLTRSQACDMVLEADHESV